ncbi:MAG: succinate dehydrogenase, cytochrome b556 subunit [Gammaproteobacteria bacterium]|nr:succinate dehydrogenase, cytochrome b556 subunit [Gammaproteobacteria bacterium]NNF59803.1 succinate dehydrogenase, cytochrome b556 subunit [Gammaproteobacteria bacterium]NNM21323.1 succinate dehydrogenase, cytochrome b556 subunit [Gammaproteobacteria bacterium]
MSEANRPLSPHLQIYRWQITMFLSIMHRATGMAMAFGLLLLALWLITAASGPEAYTRLRELLASPVGIVVLLGLAFSLFLHLCNGVRHLFWDAGVGFEKNQYRASGWIVVVASLALTAIAAMIATGVS